MPTSAVKWVILRFWALWLAVIAATNLFSLLRALHLVDRSFVFASHNFELVKSFLATYGAPHGLAIFVFSAVVAWQWLTVALFIGAPGDRKRTNAAFGAGLALFAAFLVAGEFFLRYDYEGIHMRIVIALLASLLAVHLLPDD